jgi:hypothetical protein
MTYSGTYSLTLREEKGDLLTINEVDGNFKFLNNLALTNSNSGNVGSGSILSLDGSQNNITLADDISAIFAYLGNSDYISVTLPHGTAGQVVNILKTDSDSENNLSVYGSFFGGDDHISISNSNVYMIISDGNLWYVMVGK